MDGSTEHRSAVPGFPPERPPPEPEAIRFSLDGVVERERRAVFCEFFGRQGLRNDLEPLPDVPFGIDVKVQALPGLMMMWGSLYGCHNRHTREMIAADGTDDMCLIVNLKGLHRVTDGRADLVLGDGDATFVSHADAYTTTPRPPGDILAFRVPRKQLAPFVAGLDDCFLRRIPRATPALKLLIDYAKVAQAPQGIADPALQHLVAAHIRDLMALGVGAARDAAELVQGRGLRAARLHEIKRDIEARLEQPDLSVADLAFRHGCTPRYIQRLFEAIGTTFTEFVLTQRLARACQMLTDPRRAGDKITTIALDAGFADVSYFNRAFRRVYGETPSGVRAAGPRYGADGYGGPRFFGGISRDRETCS